MKCTAVTQNTRQQLNSNYKFSATYQNLKKSEIVAYSCYFQVHLIKKDSNMITRISDKSVA